MFNIFKRKSKVERLYEKLSIIQRDAHRLSTINRQQSDKKHAEAEEVLKLIKSLEN